MENAQTKEREVVEMTEPQYRLYLRQKLEAAEADVRAGRILTHEEVVRETASMLERC